MEPLLPHAYPPREYPTGAGGPVAMVVVGDGVRSADLASYVTALRGARLLTRFDGVYLFNGRPIEILEGTPPGDRLTLMSRFPCREALEGFWYSDDYQTRIKPLRADAGRLDIGMWRVRTSEAVPGAAAAYACPAEEGPVYFFAAARRVDPARWAEYTAEIQARGLVARFGGNPISFGPPLARLEGDLADVNIVITFPCLQAVRGFWHAPDYREVRKLREGAGDLIAGVWKPFPA